VVKPDGTIITVDGSGDITVPKASSSVFGVVEVDGTSITATGGVISAAAGGNAPALVRIAQTVLASATPTVTFSSIPGTYTSLRLVMTVRSAASASDDNVFIEANADTAAHYSNQYASAVKSSPGASFNITVAPATAIIGSCPAANAPAGCAGSFSGDFPGYAATVFNKNALIQSGARDNVPQTYVFNAWWEWESTAAITSLLIGTTSGSNFVVGSTFTLYGIL
jgi:hypothetical protein